MVDLKIDMEELILQPPKPSINTMVLHPRCFLIKMEKSTKLNNSKVVLSKDDIWTSDCKVVKCGKECEVTNPGMYVQITPGARVQMSIDAIEGMFALYFEHEVLASYTIPSQHN
jgi:hypothetical protein